MPDGDGSLFWTGTPEAIRESVALSQALRRFLDRSAALKPGTTTTDALIRDLERWTERLAADPGSEEESLWRQAPRNQPPALLPALSFAEDGERLDGTVTFGRFHVGRRATHGGAVSLVFDETMGALAGSRQRTRSRTAFLNVDFRAPTPIDTPLRIRAWFEGETGRKRFLRATLANGDIVCAEAYGLWLELKPEQL